MDSLWSYSYTIWTFGQFWDRQTDSHTDPQCDAMQVLPARG